MYGEFILRNVNYNCAFLDSQQWEANNWNTSPKTTNVTHTHTHTHIYIYIYIICIYVYVYMFIYLYINCTNSWQITEKLPQILRMLHTHIYIYIYIIFMCICIYMYIYILTVQIHSLYGYIFPITIELVCTTCCRHLPINAKHHHNPVWYIMMTSSSGNIFCVTGPLYGEFTSHRWFPLTKASDAGLWCFLWSSPWINGWVNNREAGDYDAIVMILNTDLANLLNLHKYWS